MPRVVCPLCRTGFEAPISRENVAINCVSCGVAFNAAPFLTREDFAAKAESRPAPVFTPPASSVSRPATAACMAPVQSVPVSSSGKLPFMYDSRVPAAAPRPKQETSLPVLPPKPVPAAVPAPAPSDAQETRPRPAAPVLILDRSADECPVSAVASIPNAAPAAEPVSVPAASTAPAPVPAVEAQKPAAPATNSGRKKTGRRPLLEGSFGPYEIEGEIARGGVGAVFRARERDGGRLLALKVLLDGDEAGESERERFQHECETAKALSLPGMVQVYAVGEIEEKPYMAMELVKGRSLDKVIPEKSLSVNDALVLMKSVAETIGALHEAGYVHRDLKPGNILIDEFGTPKVADFGLVKSLDEVTRMTASGLVCGTPAYMAPEQARGDGKAVDPRSDVWALGAVLYELLTAQPPFQAENALRLMLRITKDQPRPPRLLNLKVPQDVHFIVMKCLEKNPERRYPNARAMAADIARFLNGEPLEVKPQPRLQEIVALARQNKRRLMVLGGAAAAVLVVAVIARFAFGPRQSGPLVERGWQALNEGSFGAAERYLRNALAIDANDARAHMTLGLCLARASIQQQRVVNPVKLQEGLSETGLASRLDPQLRADCHAQVALFNKWMLAHKEEAEEMEKAVELSPNSPKFRERLAMAYWHLGTQTQTPQYYKKAVAEFQAALSLDPAYPKVSEYIQQLKERFLSESVAQAGRR